MASTNPSEVALWQQSSGHAISEVLDRHGEYFDVLHPVLGSTELVKHGVGMLEAAASFERAALASAFDEALVAWLSTLSACPRHQACAQLLTVMGSVSGVPSRELWDLGMCIVLRARVRLGAASRHIGRDAAHLCGRDDYSLALNGLHELVRVHQEQVAASARRAAARAELLKYKTQSVVERTADEIAEKAIAEMFPDYAADFAVGKPEALPLDIDDATVLPEAAPSSGGDGPALSPTELAALWQLHECIFSNRVVEASSGERAACVMQAYFAVLRVWKGRSDLGLQCSVASTLIGAHSFALSTAITECTSVGAVVTGAGARKRHAGAVSTTEGQSSDYDFHRDAYVAEIKVALGPLRRLLARVLELLQVRARLWLRAWTPRLRVMTRAPGRNSPRTAY